MPVYRGPTGSLRGTITITGDPAPRSAGLAVPAACDLARDMYAGLFRVGMSGALADALVTVTGYDGYLPAESDSVSVPVRGCAFDTRTVALTFGQRLEVTNRDRATYMPKLLGAHSPATLALIPGGDPIRLYPEQPGRYALMDAAHDFMLADVFVLRFKTFAVTKLDGKYEILGLPVGEVTVHALLPAIAQDVEKKVRIIADKAIDLDLRLAFDRKAWEAALRDSKHKPKAP